jgi:UrcA family protein
MLLLSAALLVAPSFAPAVEPATGKSESTAGKVVLAGLDLSTSEGMAEARSRLIRMSARLCSKFRDDRNVADWETYVDCVHDTLASALKRMQTPTSSVARN